MESAVRSAEVVVKNTLKTRSEAVLLAFHSRGSLSGWGSNLLKVKTWFVSALSEQKKTSGEIIGSIGPFLCKEGERGAGADGVGKQVQPCSVRSEVLLLRLLGGC